MGTRESAEDTQGFVSLQFPSPPPGCTDESWRLLIACGDALLASLECRRRPMPFALSEILLATLCEEREPLRVENHYEERNAQESRAAARILSEEPHVQRFSFVGKDLPALALPILAIGVARYVLKGEICPIGNLRVLFGLLAPPDRWHAIGCELFSFASKKTSLLSLCGSGSPASALDAAVELTPKALGLLLNISPPVPEKKEDNDPPPMRRIWPRGKLGVGRADDLIVSEPVETAPPSAVILANPTITLDDLVLRSAVKDELQFAQHLCRRRKSAAPVICLFGPPGVGKSYAAEAFAGGLKRPLATLDIAQVRSRYCGDTEKRVQQSFREAEAAGAVLLIDEADCLLLSRTNAHYSWEVAVTNNILKLLEAPHVPVIVATNAPPESLDDAVLRRLTVNLTLCMPDREEREAIWRLELRRVGIMEDLDLHRLAEVVLSGGLIKNACSYLASKRLILRKRFAITTETAIDAAKREISKMSKSGKGNKVVGFGARENSHGAPEEAIQ